LAEFNAIFGDLEKAKLKGWTKVWVESSYFKVATIVISNNISVSWALRNRWVNYGLSIFIVVKLIGKLVIIVSVDNTTLSLSTELYSCGQLSFKKFTFMNHTLKINCFSAITPL
jgi:hypothetical protein